MGRRAEGWKLRWDKKSGIAYVRFTHGTRHELSTGERDPAAAAREAAKIYARVVAGEQVGTPGATPRLDLVDLTGDWIAAIRGTTHAESTADGYKLHMGAHIIPFFLTLDRVTTGSIGDYQRERLRKVSRITLRKERATIATFLAWCREQNLIGKIELPALPRGALGIRAVSRKQTAVDVSPSQVAAFLAALPELSKGRLRGAGRFPVRARFILAWETGLRPSTLDRLRVGEHYTRGAAELVITDAIDKARFGRTVPLTAAARAALDSVLPESGLVFGRRDYREYVREAAKVAELPKGFSPYDLRHGRALELTEASGNLPGVAFLLGHRKLTTTDKYLRGTRRAADAALAALANSGGIVGDEAPKTTAPEHDAVDAVKEKSPEESGLVRSRGLEPPRELPHWNLKLPRTGETREETRSGEPLKTAENGHAARDSGGVPQNSGGDDLGANMCELQLGAVALGSEWDWLDRVEGEA
jgi:integrase